MNAEFQRIAKRGKKPFLSDQCIDIEENNRMGVGDRKKKRKAGPSKGCKRNL